ncbi:MAG TPA: hypothetical protein VFC18_22640 [Burkholderiales bacterium]|nr:hypothetical protein [Burkholderiales bacterium]
MSLEKLKGRITVILPNQYVRYALVPWNDALEGEAEEQAYLRHHFAKVHGERAKGWAFRWSDGLASAIDKHLLDDIKRRKNVVSIQPALMAAFNAARTKIPAAGAWLVLADEDRTCVALYARGKWLAVQNARGPWGEILERERHRTATAVQEVMHVQ